MRKKKEIEFGGEAWAKWYFREEIKKGKIPELSNNIEDKIKIKKDNINENKTITSK